MTPLADSAQYEGGSDIVTQAFHHTVDLLRADHISAARASVRDPELLRELEEEFERDCEGLRSFLLAAQVGVTYFCVLKAVYRLIHLLCTYTDHRRDFP